MFWAQQNKTYKERPQNRLKNPVECPLFFPSMKMHNSWLENTKSSKLYKEMKESSTKLFESVN